MYIHSFFNTHTLELFIIRLFTFDFALLNRERVYLEMTGLATPNFLTNAKFEIKCCIVLVFLLPSFCRPSLHFDFALLNRERVFLEMTGLATPNFLTNAKFEIKCCIVFVFLPPSFVTFWFCFVKPWEGFLGDGWISNPKFLDQCKFWNKVLYCIRLSSVVRRS